MVRTLTQSGIDEYRIIEEHQISRGLEGAFKQEVAHRHNWLWGGTAWYPMEEPLPAPGGAPTPCAVEFDLKAIFSGWMVFEIRADEKCIQIQIGNVEDDELDLVRFVKMLMAGSYPHLIFESNGITVLSTYAGEKIDDCRFRARQFVQGEEHILIDVLVERNALIKAMRRLLSQIAEHPCLGVEWRYFFSIPDQILEPVLEEAEEMWSQMVRSGERADDWLNEKDFIARFISRKVDLPERFRPEMKHYRAVLTTFNNI